MFRSVLILAAAALSALPGTAGAREIVLTNDDGLTSNTVALYKALKAAGHDVVVAVPCTNQSGMGAALRFARPLAPLTADCLNGAVKAGAPGAGPMTKPGLGPDFFYVDGTPVMAMLYGIDVVGAARWGHAPDLVLSGPNEGQNLGPMTIHSGTVGNAEAALLRGIPAIALSAGADTRDDGLANPASQEVAKGAVRLVAALDAAAPGDAPMLPPGQALNVNFPDRVAGAGWRLTQVGTWSAQRIRFVPSLAAQAPSSTPMMGQAGKAGLPDQPGIAIAQNPVPATTAQQGDEAWVNRTAITVSPLQPGYGAVAATKGLSQRLGSLLKR